MFGVGPGEMLIIAILFILFVKPEEYPKMMRTVGKMLGKLKKFISDVNNNIKLN
ncbi:MAG: hypothetical protein LLG37_09830 [Spirochaetia bacterium]|nr:hypothetical protein [Spirochaetia bacterium]